MNTKQKEIFNVYISKMSFFNAAEGGQWSSERSKRDELKAAAGIDLLKWLSEGVELSTLQHYHEDNKQLTSFSDFLTNDMINAVINDSLGVVL